MEIWVGLPGDEVDELCQWKPHYRSGDRVQRAEDDEDDRRLHRRALVSSEALLLLRIEGEHLDEEISLPDDGETDDAQRGGEPEESPNHAREVVRATDGVALGGNWLNGEEAQEDDSKGCLPRDRADQR